MVLESKICTGTPTLKKLFLYFSFHETMINIYQIKGVTNEPTGNSEKSEPQMGFNTHISPLLTIESPVAPWLEHPY